MKGETGAFCSTLKGIFIAASKYGIRQYDTSKNVGSGYSYWASLERLIADSAASGRGSFTISSHMEGQEVVLEKLLEANHSAFVFPENHSDLHLGDVLFYNMGTQLRKNDIQSHTVAYNLVCKADKLLPNHFVSDVFSDIYHFSVAENPARKSGILPPSFSPIIQDLAKITVADYQRVLASRRDPDLVQNVARDASPIAEPSGSLPRSSITRTQITEPRPTQTPVITPARPALGSNPFMSPFCAQVKEPQLLGSRVGSPDASSFQGDDHPRQN